MTDPDNTDAESLAWIRRKLGLPDSAQMFTGDPNIAGTLHIWDYKQHGYETYITAYRCEEKQGEIARQAAEIRRLTLELDAIKATEVARIKHVNRLATWASQDPTGPWEKYEIQRWVLNELRACLGQPLDDSTHWQPKCFNKQ